MLQAQGLDQGHQVGRVHLKGVARFRLLRKAVPALVVHDHVIVVLERTRDARIADANVGDPGGDCQGRLGVAAASGVWQGLRKAARELDARRIPLAGLVAAFVFAAQMVNFPVAAGTSGHVIGGVLAAVLVGPWVGTVVLTVVLVVQGVFFADGGLSAIGLNVFNLAIVAVLGGYAVFLGIRAILPRRDEFVGVAAGIAAGLSVILDYLQKRHLMLLIALIALQKQLQI